jgi:hypothetical protein
MKIQWMSAVTLAAALAIGCGEKPSETTESASGTDSTSVAVTADPAQPSALQPPAAAPPAAPTTDTSARPTTGTAAPAPRTKPRSNATAPAAPAAREAIAPRAATPPPVTVREVTLPVGTALALELTSPVSTETAQIETPVSARVRQAVVVNGVTAIPAGAMVNGEVVDVDRPGRVQGRARLGLRFTSVTVDGERHSIRTNPVTFQGEASKGEDAAKIGAGAGIGAVVGGIIGGGDGAAKGAAIGGAAGTGAVLATRGRDVELPAGSDVNATLASAATIEVR